MLAIDPSSIERPECTRRHAAGRGQGRRAGRRGSRSVSVWLEQALGRRNGVGHLLAVYHPGALPDFDCVIAVTCTPRRAIDDGIVVMGEIVRLGFSNVAGSVQEEETIGSHWAPLFGAA